MLSLVVGASWSAATIHTDCLSRRRLSLSDNQSSFSLSSLTTISSSRFAAIAVDSLGVAARCHFQVLPSTCTILSTIHTIHLPLLLYSIDPFRSKNVYSIPSSHFEVN